MGVETVKTRQYASNQWRVLNDPDLYRYHMVFSPPLPLFLHYQYKPLQHQPIPVKAGSAGSASCQPKRWFLSGVLFSLSGRWSLLRGGSARISLSELDTGLLDPTRKKLTKLRSDIIDRRRKQKQRSRSHGSISPLFHRRKTHGCLSQTINPTYSGNPPSSLSVSQLRDPHLNYFLFIRFSSSIVLFLLLLSSSSSFYLFYQLPKIKKIYYYLYFFYLFYFTFFYLSSWVADTLFLFFYILSFLLL